MTTLFQPTREVKREGKMQIRELLNNRSLERRPNSSRSSASHWSVTKCDFQDLNRFLETGSAGRRPGQGRRRATMPNKDRCLVLKARRHRNMNAILLQQHLRSATRTMWFQLRLSETGSMV
ncbi:hypothetical protein TNCV_1831971 [Trichonephila clavipes]|nr:hypothetical protein TNCV_1831971 [Trichonephila clavipes]